MTTPTARSTEAVSTPDGTAGRTTIGLQAGDVRTAVELAARAPSIHNTQPWSWELRMGALNLWADRSRQLAVADPYGHSLLISCGATLAAAQIALSAQGWDLIVRRFPNPDEPDLLAEIRGVRTTAPPLPERLLAEALNRRCSERRPFGDAPVSPEDLERLRAAGSVRHVFVHFPSRAEEKLDLAVAISGADRAERADPDYAAELASWIRVDSETRDGVEAADIVHVPADAPRHTDMPLRDFEIGVTGAQLIEPGIDEHPELAIVLTDTDRPVDQLAAGEATLRLMVEAERLGLATCALSQATDMLAFRVRLRSRMNWQTHPQMMIRIGARPSGEPAQRSRRRPLDDVLRYA